MTAALSPRTDALPVYSRQYKVACAMCHTIAPRLNKFGFAFQANHFNWPGKGAPKRDDSATGVPFSVFTTSSYENNLTEKLQTTNFRALELYFTSGLGLKPGGSGGYFVNLLAASAEGVREGNLEDAYLSFPIAGRRGQLAGTIGQASPLLFQYDPVVSLTNTIPYALTEGVSDFAFAEPAPMIRLDYFNNRGSESADGLYASVGVPFAGHLELTRNGFVRNDNGVFAHVFRRWGYATAGMIGYVRGKNHQIGAIGTYAPIEKLLLAGYATLAHGEGVNTTHLSGEAEYLVNSNLALNARLELIGGSNSEISSTVAATWYPFRTSFVRLTAESRQRREDRSFSIFLRTQY